MGNWACSCFKCLPPSASGPKPSKSHRQSEQKQRAKAIPGELTAYFRQAYLNGESLRTNSYTSSSFFDIQTFIYNAPDGQITVWAHAIDLRHLAPKGQDTIVLFHYTNQLAFMNLADKSLKFVQLFASLVDERAHFGLGLYASQFEPKQWGSRLCVLLNNYSRGDPWHPDPEDVKRVQDAWGERVDFCIPILVPKSVTYNVMVQQPPDLEEKIKYLAQQGKLQESEQGFLEREHKGRLVNAGRDIWVIRPLDLEGCVVHASAETAGIMEIERKRVHNLFAAHGSEDTKALSAKADLAATLHRRGDLESAEKLEREVLEAFIRTLGPEHLHTLSSKANLGKTL